MPSDQDRLRQAFDHIGRIKAAEYPVISGRDDSYQIVERPWKDMPERSKLAIIEDAVDWSGITNRDRANILLAEIDPGRISDPQRNRLIEMAVAGEPAIESGEKLPSPAEVKAIFAEWTSDYAAAKERDGGKAEFSRILNGEHDAGNIGQKYERQLDDATQRALSRMQGKDGGHDR